MKTYRIDKGERRFRPLLFGLTLSPTRFDITASFPRSEHPQDFNWEWNRLCGVRYFDSNEVGINFRHNPHTDNIEICGYYTDMEGSELTDYAPFPFQTLANITVQIASEYIAFRIDIDGKVYIRKIEKEVNTDGPAFRLSPKMYKDSHTDFSLSLNFVTS